MSTYSSVHSARTSRSVIEDLPTWRVALVFCPVYIVEDISNHTAAAITTYSDGYPVVIHVSLQWIVSDVMVVLCSSPQFEV